MKSLSSAAAAALVSLFPVTALAEEAVKVEAQKASFDDLQSPMFNTGKNKSGFSPRDWLEVETEIQVSMAPEPKNKTLDKLTVKWYVAVKNQEKGPKYLKFSREIEYVNIPVGEKVFCSVYLSPASIRRLTGSDRAGKRSVESVGFEISVNGQEVASGSDKGVFDKDRDKDKKWWSSAKFADAFAESDVVPLLRKSETPFANSWWDRYAEELRESSKR